MQVNQRKLPMYRDKYHINCVPERGWSVAQPKSHSGGLLQAVAECERRFVTIPLVNFYLPVPQVGNQR